MEQLEDPQKTIEAANASSMSIEGLFLRNISSLEFKKAYGNRANVSVALHTAGHYYASLFPRHGDLKELGCLTRFPDISLSQLHIAITERYCCWGSNTQG